MVERPVDKWITSFTRALVDGVYFGVNGFFLCTLGQYLNLKVIVIGRDMLMGRLKASTRGDVIEKLPTVHKEHHAMVRSRVPPAQLQDLKLQDGWEPLCQFLDVPVPGVPFPHVNDTKQILSMANGMIVKMLTDTGLALGYWVLLATGAGLMLREKSRHHIFELVGGFFSSVRADSLFSRLISVCWRSCIVIKHLGIAPIAEHIRVKYKNLI